MSNPRLASSISVPLYRQSLLAPIKLFLTAGAFVGGPVAQGSRWTPMLVAMTALLMVWSEPVTLTDRFNFARGVIGQMFPTRQRVGRTYQGFIKRLIKWSPRLLSSILTHLQQVMFKIAGPYWYVGGWVALAVAGSRIDLPRTEANERAFGCAGNKKTTPQARITTLWHIGLGLPWAWKIGKADASERHHLRQMIHLLPQAAMLVADAGFTGHELWTQLINSGRSILIRVGSNVHLLRKLGYHYKEKSDIVYLWPKTQRDHDPAYGWPTERSKLDKLNGGILLNLELRQPKVHDGLFVDSSVGEATKLEELAEEQMAWVFDQTAMIGSHQPPDEMTHREGLNVMYTDGHATWHQIDIPFYPGFPR